jgi:aminopeptidase N
MENTTTTIFSDGFVVDSIAFVDKNYVNVNAHELAHQWFGDLVTETSGTHHWLQEGFATYYALLAERSVFGCDYYYWRLFEYAQELLEQDKARQSTSLLNPKSSSTTFYKKGAWVLHLLREKVGDEAFRKAVKNYLQKHEFKNVETEDFINEVEKTSGRDLKSFITLWLESDVLNFDEILENLELNSTSIKQYLQYDCEETPEICKLFLLNQNDSFYKERIVESLKNNISKSTFLTDDIKTRQAIAKSLVAIPSNLKQDYETLLDDKSYLTVEIALYNLWKNFPESRKEYLEKTKGVYGFNDKNVRMLWLALTLNTPEFEFENSEKYFEELRNYTNPKYDFNIRQNAFQYLRAMQACDSVCKANLREAAQHHNWRFSKFAKSMLSEISETKE